MRGQDSKKWALYGARTTGCITAPDLDVSIGPRHDLGTEHKREGQKGSRRTAALVPSRHRTEAARKGATAPLRLAGTGHARVSGGAGRKARKQPAEANGRMLLTPKSRLVQPGG